MPRSVKSRRYEGRFAPHMGVRSAIHYPGPLDIFEAGGAALDPGHQLLLVNPDEIIGVRSTPD